MNSDIEIVNGEALRGPGCSALAAMVEQVANDFDREYTVRDDPMRHGRVFTVTEADALARGPGERPRRGVSPGLAEQEGGATKWRHRHLEAASSFHRIRGSTGTLRF